MVARVLARTPRTAGAAGWGDGQRMLVDDDRRVRTPLPTSRRVSILSTAGGCGASTIAAHVAAYSAARTALLEEEIELRRHLERVAAQRRALPPGGEVSGDYRFQGEDGATDFAGLFGDKLTPLVAHLAERDELTATDIAEIEALLKGLKS